MLKTNIDMCGSTRWMNLEGSSIGFTTEALFALRHRGIHHPDREARISLYLSKCDDR